MRNVASRLVNHYCAREACRQRFYGTLRSLYCSDACRRAETPQGRSYTGQFLPSGATSIPRPAATPPPPPSPKAFVPSCRTNLCPSCFQPLHPPMAMTLIRTARYSTKVCRPCGLQYEERRTAHSLFIAQARVRAGLMTCGSLTETL